MKLSLLKSSLLLFFISLTLPGLAQTAIVRPAQSLPAVPAGTSAAISPRTFGAIANGATNDAPALQAAVTAATAAGGYVGLDAHMYRVYTPIVFGSDYPVDPHIFLSGAGMAGPYGSGPNGQGSSSQGGAGLHAGVSNMDALVQVKGPNFRHSPNFERMTFSGTNDETTAYAIHYVDTYFSGSNLIINALNLMRGHFTACTFLGYGDMSGMADSHLDYQNCMRDTATSRTLTAFP